MQIPDVDLQTVVSALHTPAANRSDADIDNIFTFLQATDIVRGWRRWAIRDLCRAAQYQELAAEQVLLEASAATEKLYFIITGAVLCGRRSLSSGHWIKEGLNLLESTLQGSEVRAIESSKLLVIPLSAYFKLRSHATSRTPRKREGRLRSLEEPLAPIELRFDANEVDGPAAEGPVQANYTTKPANSHPQILVLNFDQGLRTVPGLEDFATEMPVATAAGATSLPVATEATTNISANLSSALLPLKTVSEVSGSPLSSSGTAPTSNQQAFRELSAEEKLALAPLDLSRLPPPPPRPLVSYRALARRDVVFDEQVGDYISCPAPAASPPRSSTANGKGTEESMAKPASTPDPRARRLRFNPQSPGTRVMPAGSARRETVRQRYNDMVVLSLDLEFQSDDGGGTPAASTAPAAQQADLGRRNSAAALNNDDNADTPPGSPSSPLPSSPSRTGGPSSRRGSGNQNALLRRTISASSAHSGSGAAAHAMLQREETVDSTGVLEPMSAMVVPAPEDRAYIALSKVPEKRTDNDILVLDEEMQRLTVFAFHPQRVRYELYRHLTYHEFYDTGSVVLPPDKRTLHWWVVLGGAVTVSEPLDRGRSSVGKVQLLTEGDCFGAECPQPAAGSTVVTAAPTCQLASVPAEKYRAALATGAASTANVEEHGKVVLVTEKRELSEKSEAASAPKSKSRHVNVIVKGAPRNLAAMLFERNDVHGRHQDEHYVEDFLLTYRTFMTPKDLFSVLLRALSDASTRNRAVSLLKRWLDDYADDFRSAEMRDQLEHAESTMYQLLYKDRHARDLVEGIRATRKFFERRSEDLRALVTIAPPVTEQNIGSKLGVTLVEGPFLAALGQTDLSAYETEAALFPQILYVAAVNEQGWAASAGIVPGMRLHQTSTGEDGSPCAGDCWSLKSMLEAVNSKSGPALINIVAKTDNAGLELAKDGAKSAAVLPLIFRELVKPRTTGAANPASPSVQPSAAEHLQLPGEATAGESSKPARSSASSTGTPTTAPSPYVVSSGLSGSSTTTGAGPTPAMTAAVAAAAAAATAALNSSSASTAGHGSSGGSFAMRRSGSLVSRLLHGLSGSQTAATTSGSSSPVARSASGSSAVALLTAMQDRFDPEVHQVIKVYRYPDHSSRFVVVSASTSVQQLVDYLGSAWPLPAALRTGLANDNRLVLVEVSVDPTKPDVVTQSRLPAAQTNLQEPRSLCSRYYVATRSSLGLDADDTPSANSSANGQPGAGLPLPADAPSLLPEEARRDLLETVPRDILAEVDARTVAEELARVDFELFARIRPAEYIAYLWQQDSEPEKSNVQVFVHRFNWMVNWVKTLVLSHRNIAKRRADCIKAFIKIARHCLLLQDFNALFAIVSGLASPPISRLKATWERLASKYAESYEALEGLMDPTRNMAKYRSRYAEACKNPPVVPFFPLLMKDLAFMHEGNKSKLDGLVNFEKMRMLSHELRQVKGLVDRSSPLINNWLNSSKLADASLPKIWAASDLRRRVRCALQVADVISDEERFMGQSFLCEPSQQVLKRLKISEPVPQKLGKAAAGALLERSDAAAVFGPKVSTSQACEPAAGGSANATNPADSETESTSTRTLRALPVSTVMVAPIRRHESYGWDDGVPDTEDGGEQHDQPTQEADFSSVPLDSESELESRQRRGHPSGPQRQTGINLDEDEDTGSIHNPPSADSLQETENGTLRPHLQWQTSDDQLPGFLAQAAPAMPDAADRLAPSAAADPDRRLSILSDDLSPEFLQHVAPRASSRSNSAPGSARGSMFFPAAAPELQAGPVAGRAGRDGRPKSESDEAKEAKISHLRPSSLTAHRTEPQSTTAADDPTSPTQQPAPMPPSSRISSDLSSPLMTPGRWTPPPLPPPPTSGPDLASMDEDISHLIVPAPSDDFCLPAEHEAVNLPPISRERHLTGSVETSAHQQGLYHYVQSPDIAASGSARQSWRESGPIKPLMGVGLPDAGLQEESQTDDLGPPPPPEDPENLLDNLDAYLVPPPPSSLPNSRPDSPIS